MPETHNTMAFYGGPPVACRSQSLEIQVVYGVRVLDILVKHDENALAIYHGFVFQSAWLSDVLKVCVKFLNRFRSETLLLRLKEEGEGYVCMYVAAV